MTAVEDTLDRITDASGEAELPVTFDQEQRLMFREIQQERSAPLFSQRLVIGFRMSGSVETHLLQMALDELVRRHTAIRVQFFPASNTTLDERREKAVRFLRTGIAESGLYSQSVVEVGPVPLRVIELPGNVALDNDLQRVIDEELLRPTPSLDPPHLQAVLATFAAGNSILMLFIDHLVADGLSMQILRRDFRHMLRMAVESQDPSSDASESGFLTYAKEQKKRTTNGGFSESLRFWRTQWARYGSKRVATGHFPFMTASATTQTTRSFASTTTLLDGSTAGLVKDLVKQCRVTQHAFFLAAFGMMLRNIKGTPEVAVWNHFSNRRKAAYLGSVGWFAQTHLVGFEIPEGQTARELLSEVHGSVLKCSKHQELPLPHLWADWGCYPRFQDARVLLDFIPYTSPRSEAIGAVLVEDIHLPDSSAPRLASFGVYVKDLGDKISITIRYVDTLYAAVAVEQFLCDYAVLLKRIVCDPDVRVSDFLTTSPPNANTNPATEAMSEFVIDARLFADFAGRS